jgi:hypothetical protein
MANLEAIEQELRSLGWWYQHFELPNGLRNGERPRTGLRCQGTLELHSTTCPGMTSPAKPCWIWEVTLASSPFR